MKFIVFEGLDGAGKSTLIESLQQAVVARGEAVTVTREPGGTELGREIRELLLRVKGPAPSARAELLLYEADRAHHVETVVQPARERGEWVLCDRFSASSVAFQAGGRQLDRSQIDWLNDFAVNGCEPDLWVLLDLSTAEAQRRLSTRERDRFENENLAFHERVRRAYLDLAAEPHQRDKWLVLDASLSQDDLRAELFAALRTKQWL